MTNQSCIIFLAHPVLINGDLNALMLKTSTVCWSNRFHLLITLFEKKYLVISLVHWVLTNLHECPLVPLLFSSTVKSSCSEMLLNPLYILNTSIRSCLLRLSSRVHSSKHHYLSPFLISCTLIIILVYLCCIFSNNTLSLL